MNVESNVIQLSDYGIVFHKRRAVSNPWILCGLLLLAFGIVYHSYCHLWLYEIE